MKKLILYSLFALVANFASATTSNEKDCSAPLHPDLLPVTLDWTSSAGSVQGVIHGSLYIKYFEKLYDELTYDKGVVTIEFEGQKLVCSEKSQGMLAVQAYQCEFPQRLFAWTSASNSIQAILYDSMYDVLQREMNYEFKTVKQGPNRSLILEDKKSRLTCEAATLGMAQVMSYQCKLEIL